MTKSFRPVISEDGVRKKRKKEQIKHEHALNHRRQHSSYKGFDFVDSLKSVKRNTSLAKTTSCFAADLKAADIYVSFCNSLSAVLIFYASTSDWPPEAFCCGVVLVRESECVCACARDSLWTRFLTNRLWEFFPNVQFGVTGGSILHSNWKAVRGCCKNKMLTHMGSFKEYMTSVIFADIIIIIIIYAHTCQPLLLQ